LVRRDKIALLMALAVVGCSKAPRRRMNYATRAGLPVLEVHCEPGDRLRIVHPAPSDERRCDGKEVAGAEVFQLQPGDFTLGHNSWAVSVTSAKGAAIPLKVEFDYAPKPDELNRLFAFAEPKGGADAVATPPEVAAPFLPGAPHTPAAVADGELVFLLKAPSKTQMEVAGKTFVVEGGKGTEVRVPLLDTLFGIELREVCAPLEVPARVVRTDGVIHEGKLTVSRAAPRLLRPLEDEKGVIPPGAAKAHTALVLRDDGECWSLGETKLRNVALVVLIDQLRRDLAPCREGYGKLASETPRVALDVAMGAFDPRTGRRHGEKTLLAPTPRCRTGVTGKDKGADAAAFSVVDSKVITKWVATLK
jgi:hypothetical protein